jgi:hypothetical protein
VSRAEELKGAIYSEGANYYGAVVYCISSDSDVAIKGIFSNFSLLFAFGFFV